MPAQLGFAGGAQSGVADAQHLGGAQGADLGHFGPGLAGGDDEGAVATGSDKGLVEDEILRRRRLLAGAPGLIGAARTIV